MSKVFFISDLHFGHKYVIAFDKRPFKNVQEMEREMIRRWSAKVSPEDHVFVVGDMFGKVTTAHAGEIVHTLNGKIHLIRGNHDPKGELFESLFEEVVPSKAIQVRVRGEKQRVIMRHRLLPVFKGNDEGVVQLYGHTHGSAVADMEVGQIVDVHLMPEEAYGQSDPEAIITIEIAQLPGSENLNVGERVYLRNMMGQPFPANTLQLLEKDGERMKIAWFCIPAHGHTNPTLGLVKELTEAGHQVYYFSFEMFRDKIERAGAAFIGCDGYDFEMEDKENADRVGKDKAFATELLVSSTLALDEMTTEKVGEIKPDLVVSDSVAFWGKLVAMKHGLPYISSTTTFAFNRYSAKYMKETPWDIAKMLLYRPE